MHPARSNFNMSTAINPAPFCPRHLSISVSLQKKALMICCHSTVAAHFLVSPSSPKSLSQLGGFVGEDSVLCKLIHAITKFWRKQWLIWRQLPPTSRNLPGLICRHLCNGLEIKAVKVALSRTFLPTPFGDNYDDDDPCAMSSVSQWSGLVWLFQTPLSQLL
jgi:hypothetical protein